MDLSVTEFFLQTLSKHWCLPSKPQRWHPCWSQKKCSRTTLPGNKMCLKRMMSLIVGKPRLCWSSAGLWPHRTSLCDQASCREEMPGENWNWPKDQVGWGLTWPRLRCRPCHRHSTWSEKSRSGTDLSKSDQLKIIWDPTVTWSRTRAMSSDRWLQCWSKLGRGQGVGGAGPAHPSVPICKDSQKQRASFGGAALPGKPPAVQIHRN